MDVRQALRSRHSVRAFLPTEVPRETLLRVFESAQRAPSWCNIQPWRVTVVSGAARTRMTGALLEAAENQAPRADFPFPAEYPEPYGSHRRACGRALYEVMGIERSDTAARRAAWMRNFVAFDAPHIAVVAMDRRFGVYGAIDIGCWLQSVMLAAVEEGLATCPQASIATFPDVIRSILPVGEELGILCGIAIGYEDGAAVANRCRTERSPVSDNVAFVE